MVSIFVRGHRGFVLSSLAAALLLGACAAPPYSSGYSSAGSYGGGPPPAVVVTLSTGYVFAPVKGDAVLELEDLATRRENAARLRRAWIHVERRQPQAAVDACALVLYGPEEPSPMAEAFARYIRAEAFARRGEPERGRYDRQRALELALDPALRERIGRSSETGARPAAAGGHLAVQKRSSWRPDALIAARLNPMGKVYRLTIHHSAMLFRSTQAQACAAQLRVIQRNHMRNPDRRYGDIGYHFLIDPAGRVWQGRDLRWQGAHARHQNNRGNVGICVLGNFIRGGGGQTPNDVQLRSLRQLVRQLAQTHRIRPDQVFSHSDFVNTECPGPYLEPVVRSLSRELRAVAAHGGRATAGTGGAGGAGGTVAASHE